MPIESSQAAADLGSLPRYFSLKDCALFSLHEVYHFFGGDFRAVDVEGIAHGILADEVEDLHPLDAVLLVDEEVKLLPLLSHNVKTGALEDELAQSLQDADMDSQTGRVLCLYAPSMMQALFFKDGLLHAVLDRSFCCWVFLF